MSTSDPTNVAYRRLNPNQLLGTLADAAWPVLAAAGAAAIILGILALLWPGVTLVVAGAVFGIYLLTSGIFQLAGAFASHVPGHLRALGFVSGTIAILLGLLCFRGPAQSILLLALWIGFGWLLRGIMTVAMVASSPDLPARGWQALLGALTLIAGIVLITSPFRSIVTLTVVVGVWLIALGIMEVVHAIQLRRQSRRLGASG